MKISIFNIQSSMFNDQISRERRRDRRGEAHLRLRVAAIILAEKTAARLSVDYIQVLFVVQTLGWIRAPNRRCVRRVGRKNLKRRLTAWERAGKRNISIFNIQ